MVMAIPTFFGLNEGPFHGLLGLPAYEDRFGHDIM
jgi:hypothetical protein